jgi:hypothetical protein
MSDPLSGRQRRGDESDAGSGWAAELAVVDTFEVALRNLLSVRGQVVELSRTWDRSARLAPLSARVVQWISDCAGDEIVEAIGDLRAGLEAAGGQPESGHGGGEEPSRL